VKVHLFDVNVHITNVDLNTAVVKVNEACVNRNGTKMKDPDVDVNHDGHEVDANVTNMNVHLTAVARAAAV
jgi:hypothetical protein